MKVAVSGPIRNSENWHVTDCGNERLKECTTFFMTCRLITVSEIMTDNFPIIEIRSHKERMQFMKKILTFAALAILIVASSSNLTASGVRGNAEEYHYALNLCFQHSADNAKALFNQASKGELNLEIAKDFVEQIGSDLDHARVYHAMMHKTYSEADTKMISEEHLAILGGQASAVTAFATLKAEMEKTKPDVSTIKTLSATIFEGAKKAVTAHLDAMKKLGIPEPKSPGA